MPVPKTAAVTVRSLLASEKYANIVIVKTTRINNYWFISAFIVVTFFYLTAS